MNYGPLIFLAAFFALASSWFGFVLTPQMKLGHLQPTNTVSAGVSYPLPRSGSAREGIEVYRANGCAYCHSQQLVQSGTVCDVILNEAGTNQSAVISALRQIKPELSGAEAQQWLANLPRTVLEGVKKPSADVAISSLKSADAKAELWVRPVGPDISRGWGKRRSVAEDFLYDYPVMPGAQRIGPDLASVGLRRPDEKWHLLHLYAPQLPVTDSTMPPYRFLFETRRIAGSPSPEALPLTGSLAPRPGYEVVPTRAARGLVAYLASLRGEADLFATPMSVVAAPAPPQTNAPDAATITNAVPTNSPAK